MVALPDLMTAVIIVGGVLSGVMTATESGAFGAIRAVLVTIFVYREINWDKFRAAVVTSVDQGLYVIQISSSCQGDPENPRFLHSYSALPRNSWRSVWCSAVQHRIHPSLHLYSIHADALEPELSTQGLLMATSAMASA